MKDKKLENLRREIDACDVCIAQAFVRRMELVQEIAQHKNQNQIPIYDAGRETEILNRITKYAHKSQVQSLIRFVLDMCRSSMHDISIQDDESR